jgi:hypothetical protein
MSLTAKERIFAECTVFSTWNNEPLIYRQLRFHPKFEAFNQEMQIKF